MNSNDLEKTKINTFYHIASKLLTKKKNHPEKDSLIHSLALLIKSNKRICVKNFVFGATNNKK